MLQRYEGEARVLGGGQSLVPLLNLRLSRPQGLIDITRIPSLTYIRARENKLFIGAATPQSAVERSPLVAARWPLLRRAVTHVGHPQTRSRGTIGGSIAHADPAAELPVALAALDGRIHLKSARGMRIVEWPDFFETEFMTACAEDEMVTAIELPAPTARTGVAFREYATRHGDFAVAGAASVVSLDGDGRCAAASLALLASGPGPVRAREAEHSLVGKMITRDTAADAADLAAEAAEFRAGHTEMPADYRRHVLRGLLENAILEAGRGANHASASEARS